MGRLAILTASTVRSAAALSHVLGDQVGATHATFPVPGATRVILVSGGIAITPASGDVEVPSLYVNVFKSADAPAAVADSSTLALAATVMAKGHRRLPFPAAGFFDQLGRAITAGSTSAYQEVPWATSVPRPTAVLDEFRGISFEFVGSESRELTLVLRASATWTPAAVDYRFDIRLGVEIF